MWNILIFLFLISYVNGLGCMRKVCEGNEKNELRDCTVKEIDGKDYTFCGTYNTQRLNGEILPAIDIKCGVEKSVYAPFDGELSTWRPFGRSTHKKCADEGARIEGTGQWQGYVVYISSVKLNFYGGTVSAGDIIGSATNRECYADTNQKDTKEPYIQLRLTRGGKDVDPTFHLQQCMCTGQICESNTKNRLIGQAFKIDSRYNGVRGWEIECPLVKEKHEEPTIPLIYSPIEGNIIGRVRLTHDASNGAYNGCENDGIFILGQEGWTDFEVKIYNVKARSDLGFGRKRIAQGEPIAERLSCNGSPDSIFMEIRHNGKLVDLTDVIMANNCKLPENLPGGLFV